MTDIMNCLFFIFFLPLRLTSVCVRDKEKPHALCHSVVGILTAEMREKMKYDKYGEETINTTRAFLHFV